MIRRRSFAWIVVVALVLTAGATAFGHGGPKARTLEGTWLVRVDFPPFSPFQYLQHFTPGHKATLLLSWGVPPCAEAQPPTCEPPEYWADTRVGCMGDWTRRGRRTYDVTMYCLPHQGDGYVPDRIRIRAVLSKDGKRFNGDGFTYTGFNEDGSVAWSGQGAMDGKRLRHVPLP
jgi:hypothetical protein